MRQFQLDDEHPAVVLRRSHVREIPVVAQTHRMHLKTKECHNDFHMSQRPTHITSTFCGFNMLEPERCHCTTRTSWMWLNHTKYPFSPSLRKSYVFGTQNRYPWCRVEERASKYRCCPNSCSWWAQLEISTRSARERAQEAET